MKRSQFVSFGEQLLYDEGAVNSVETSNSITHAKVVVSIPTHEANSHLRARH
jgi:hypothetical protein